MSATGTVGPHTQGKAVDVKIAGEQAFQLIKSALALGFHGIGINQNGDWERRYIHLDIAGPPGKSPKHLDVLSKKRRESECFCLGFLIGRFFFPLLQKRLRFN